MSRSTHVTFQALAATAAFVFSTASPSRASAEGVVALDVDYAAPLDETGVSSGFGFGVRVGAQLHAPLIAVTPELGFSYHRFGGPAELATYGGTAGLRLGIGEVIRPGVFAHVGYGARKTELPGRAEDSGALTYDLGAFLDFTLLPILDIGAHGGYNNWTGASQPAFPFLTFGGHAGLVF
jgi:hypothetical protein